MNSVQLSAKSPSEVSGNPGKSAKPKKPVSRDGVTLLRPKRPNSKTGKSKNLRISLSRTHRTKTFKSVKKSTRGRKAGDGVLKELTHDMTLRDLIKRMAHGRRADDPVFELTMQWRALVARNRELYDREKVLGTDRVRAAEKGADDPEAARFILERAQFRRRYEDARVDLEISNRLAMERGDSAWFRRVADSLDAARHLQDSYPVHTSLLSLAEIPQRDGERGLPFIALGGAMSKTPRYTISEICDRLRSLQPQGQPDEDFARAVRRACGELGFPLLAGKPGPRRKA